MRVMSKGFGTLRRGLHYRLVHSLSTGRTTNCYWGENLFLCINMHIYICIYMHIRSIYILIYVYTCLCAYELDIRGYMAAQASCNTLATGANHQSQWYTSTGASTERHRAVTLNLANQHSPSHPLQQVLTPLASGCSGASIRRTLRVLCALF